MQDENPVSRTRLEKFFQEMISYTFAAALTGEGKERMR